MSIGADLSQGRYEVILPVNKVGVNTTWPGERRERRLCLARESFSVLSNKKKYVFFPPPISFSSYLRTNLQILNSRERVRKENPGSRELRVCQKLLHSILDILNISVLETWIAFPFKRHACLKLNGKSTWQKADFGFPDP